MCSADGHLYHGSDDDAVRKDYGGRLQPNDLLTVTLDLRGLESEGGILSYAINDIDHGIAFKDIDVDKTYKLCVDCRGDSEYVVMLNV